MKKALLTFLISILWFSALLVWIAYWYQNYYCVWNWVIQWVWDWPWWDWCVLWDWLDFSDKNSPISVSFYINSPTATSTTNQNVTLYISWYDDTWIAKMDIKEANDNTCSDVKDWATVLSDATYNSIQNYTLTEWNWEKFVCLRLSDAAWNTSNWVTTANPFYLRQQFVVNSVFPYAWNNTIDQSFTLKVRWEWLWVWSFEYRIEDPDWVSVSNWTATYNWATMSLELSQNFKNLYDAYNANKWWTVEWTVAFTLVIIWPDELWNPLSLERNVPSKLIVYDGNVTWSDPSNAIRMIRSMWIMKQLKNAQLIDDLPYVQWCWDKIVPIAIVDSKNWCFQIWSVIEIWWWLEALIEWNCQTDSTSSDDTLEVLWPIWVKNWEEDITIIRNRLYDPRTCDLDSPESMWYNDSWDIRQ